MEIDRELFGQVCKENGEIHFNYFQMTWARISWTAEGFGAEYKSLICALAFLVAIPDMVSEDLEQQKIAS
jgi:hypothetical protein